MARMIQTNEFSSWDRFYRAHFINSLSGFKSASLIATCDADGKPNLAIFSNIVHIGADPGLIGYINRPREAAPHTLTNIELGKHYTINLITEEMVEKAHQTSAKYDASTNEFEAVGLTPEWLAECPVPFVKESPVKYSMELRSILPIELNGTFLVIGQVKQVILPEDIVNEDGFIFLEKTGIITSLGIDAYYKTEKIDRLSYAKPGMPLKSI